MDTQGPLPSTRSQGQTSISEKRYVGCQEPAGSKHSYPDPVPARNRSPSPATSIFSRSSGWSGLPRGSLRVILAKAISRWARAGSSSSTISSSASSVYSNSRQARPSSVATNHTTHTETIIRARRQAWEQGRGIPREFLLFLPTVLVPQVVGHSSQDRRICRSASLPLVLSQLDAAIKRTAKSRRSRDPSIPWEKQSSVSSYQRSRGPSIPWGKQSSLSSSHTLQDKGKFREDPPIRSTDGKSERRPAWWLDVSSPTWKDIREIGQLLHIHPLTLEDILQQEPREKLEVFPRLGYYFIVFRALESERTRTSARARLDLTMKDDTSATPFTEGMVGATNVYIIVFRDGICTFHFQDISEHTSRVRNRIMQFEETFHVSSDWIAHGVLDSIVDEVFPLLDLIEREIEDLDHIVLSISGPLRNREELKHGTVVKDTESKPTEANEVKTVDTEKINTKSQTESSGINETPTWSIRYADSSSGKHYFHRLTSIFAIWKAKRRSKPSSSMETSSSPAPLVRIASTRRLVTSLARLLGSKSDVVSQTRKRLTQGLVGSDVTLSKQGLAGEVDIYLGDIQDHILSLQQSLAYYERMLSQLHPAYISHLRSSLTQAKVDMDRRFFVLSLFASSVMVMDVVSSLCATNINVPSNNQAATPPAPFYYFIGIVILECLLGVGVLFLARWLRRMNAKRRYACTRRNKSPN